eukprot:1923175-Rhodomonas_salina.1
MSMCFAFSRAAGFLTIAMQPSLSSKIVVGASCGGPSSFKSWRRYDASCAARAIAWYSDSDEDRATVCCSLLFQLTVVPLNRNT